MPADELDVLNRRFGLPGILEFIPIQGGLAAARIRNRHASATVALHGAQVLAFQPVGGAPVLWMSSESRFEAGAPIRGGIPVCWPWFGAHPGGEAGMPFHGFARLEEWNVIGAGETAGGATRMELGLGESPRTTALWPHPFDLRLEVVVGADLRVALAMRNTGRVPFTCTCALHSYFAVGDIAAVRVLGLEGCRYADTVPVPEREAVQECPVLIEAETDRVYEDTEAATVIEDASLRRRIRVAKEGSRTTVVWNPWIAKSSRMPDFGDTEYRGMLCVETANARADARTIPPGGAHRLAATISVGPTA